MPINTKQALLDEIKAATQSALTWFDAIPADQFFVRGGEAWSASDNVDHLIRALEPVILALKLPKFVLQILFGKPLRPSKSYAEICKAYEDVLAKGVGASGRYLPNQQTPTNKEEYKATLLKHLSKAGNALAATLDEKWPEAALDECQLPHPLLGKLTVREMLFFSIYHMLRHARAEGD